MIYISESWAHLADWKKELEPFYPLASKMLGANTNPKLQVGDKALQQSEQQMGKKKEFDPTNVAVFFGQHEKTVSDPYFDSIGLDHAGCNFCGGCMTGCRYNAKNTLDKNYLYMARQLGIKVQPESEVYDVIPIGGSNGSAGYEIKWKQSIKFFKKKGSVSGKNIIFARGVLGTVPLLLKLKKKSFSKYL